MRTELPYLARLTADLTEAAAALPTTVRRGHAEYLRRCQNPDGGFGGRDPTYDLYYTAFALRGLAILDDLTSDVAERAARFLRQRLTGQAQVVDFFSWLYAALLVQAAAGIDVLADAPPDWPDRVARLLESFRAADGGYSRTPGGPVGSVYQTFLVALCYEMLGREWPHAPSVRRFVRSRQRDDGGFVDLAPMKRSGTNPTAAAVALLRMMQDLDPATRAAVVDRLVSSQSPEGGFTANSRIPSADLLSTFTACWTLRECGALDRIDRGSARRYVESLARTEGGFRGGSWDHGVDVEYTFYGLGSAALLTAPTG
ncbi:MAG: geranyl transferase [Gemmataceae bacterium]|nr:geranyl transferase [Gemmataceae bacterium]